MTLQIHALDHVVLNVADVERSVEFYANVLGMRPERLAEFRRGAVKFASIRVTPDTIIDLFPPAMHQGPAAGRNVNHIAFDVDASPSEIERFLDEHAIETIRKSPNNFGARGMAHSYYVHDPDGNVVELRTYRP